MKKLFMLLAIIFIAFTSLTFSQAINIGEVNDSTITTFNFCLIIPERVDSLVTLQCADEDGTIVYMEIREDIFHGKINIIITPNAEDGPITEERTINWFMLPEKEIQ